MGARRFVRLWFPAFPGPDPVDPGNEEVEGESRRALRGAKHSIGGRPVSGLSEVRRELHLGRLG
jgi:hypothetical protein